MATIDVERAKIRVGLAIAASVLLSAGYVGMKLGDWNRWRDDTTQDVQDLKKAVFPNNERPDADNRIYQPKGQK